MPLGELPVEAGSEPSLRELPSLVPLLGRIGSQLLEARRLGVLSVSVLRRQSTGERDSWNDYESVLRAAASFLAADLGGSLRRTDTLLAPIVAGNTLVVLIGPPRRHESLDPPDLARVRHRVARAMRAHLEREVTREVAERYGVFIGAALMHHAPEVAGERIIYRAVEEAFADALGQRRREELRQVLHVDRIVRSRRIRTVFQPVVDLVDRSVIGFEALARVPRHKFASPERMFQIAREQGALWPLERLCRARAIETLPPLESGQHLFLNVEPPSCSDPELHAPTFVERLTASGLDPGRLVLEITEHVAGEHTGEMLRALEGLREIGFRVAMDDVGSGCSNLQAISALRPDFLKIDMSLVRHVHLDRLKRELVATMCRFAHNTGITIIAEGVESEAELAVLLDVGVRCAQGYLFAEPAAPPRSPDWALILRAH